MQDENINNITETKPSHSEALNTQLHDYNYYSNLYSEVESIIIE